MTLRGDCAGGHEMYGLWPLHCTTARLGDPCSTIGANGTIQVEAAVVDRMRAM
jgi:hypothetical protein